MVRSVMTVACTGLPMVVIALGCGRVAFDRTGTDDSMVAVAGDVPLAGDPELVAYWSLDEAVGAMVFVDSSGYANHGACTQCPTAGVPGVRGTAIELGDAAAAIRISAGPRLATLAGPLTVAAWVRLTDRDTYGAILSSDRDCCGAYAGFSLWASYYEAGPALLLWDGTTPRLANASTIDLDRWVHVAGTFDGTTSRVYADAVLVAEATGGAIGTPFSFDLAIGAMGYSAPDYHISGARIDELLVLSRALTLDEVAALRATYSPP